MVGFMQCSHLLLRSICFSYLLARPLCPTLNDKKERTIKRFTLKLKGKKKDYLNSIPLILDLYPTSEFIIHFKTTLLIDFSPTPPPNLLLEAVKKTKESNFPKKSQGLE